MRPQYAVIAAIALLAAAPAVRAADSYPSRPIRMIVPFPAAGATDILARVVSQKLARRIEAAGRRRQPRRRGRHDRLAHRRRCASPTATRSSWAPRARTRSARACTRNGRTTRSRTSPRSAGSRPRPRCSWSRPRSPANSVKELIALAKAKPGQLNFGSSGIGTQFHLSGELLKLLAGIDMVHVPYKGTALVYPDMFSGQIAILFDVPPVALPFIKAGRIKALGVSGKKRARRAARRADDRRSRRTGLRRGPVVRLSGRRPGMPRDRVAALQRSSGEAAPGAGHGRTFRRRSARMPSAARRRRSPRS